MCSWRVVAPSFWPIPRSAPPTWKAATEAAPTMQSLLGNSPGVFVGLTVVIIGGAAIMTGRALADGWKPAWQVVAACFGLALADRFLVYALFQGQLLSLSGFIVDFAVLTALGLIAHRLTMVHKM